MFRLLRLFFTIFGVVSFIFWLGIWYGWSTDAYGARTATVAIVKVFKTSMSPSNESGVNESNTSPLTHEQQVALESQGINAGALPVTLNPEQQQCMTEKIGQERVEAIMTGATPTPMEVISGASCL
ncbi:MAG: hypothetical protein ACK42D_02670 [Candidatus Paceibacteria bacterium]